MTNGKGDRRRPEDNKKFRKNHDEIFNKKFDFIKGIEFTKAKIENQKNKKPK